MATVAVPISPMVCVRHGLIRAVLANEAMDHCSAERFSFEPGLNVYEMALPLVLGVTHIDSHSRYLSRGDLTFTATHSLFSSARVYRTHSFVAESRW